MKAGLACSDGANDVASKSLKKVKLNEGLVGVLHVRMQ